MEVNKPEDSSTGDTPEAVVDPAVSVIPDAGAGAAQEAEVPPSSPAKVEVDKPKDLNAGDSPEAVAGPSVPVAPDAGAGAPQEATVPVSYRPRLWLTDGPNWDFDFKTTVQVPPEDPEKPEAGPSWKKSFIRRRFDDKEARARYSASLEAPSPPFQPYRRAQPKPGIPVVTIDISEDTTDPDPQAEPRRETSHDTIDISEETADQIKEVPAEPKPETSEETIHLSGDPTDPVTQASAEPRPGTTKETSVDISDMPGFFPFVFMEGMEDLLQRLVQQKKELMANPPEVKSEDLELAASYESMQRKSLPDDHRDDTPEPKRAEPAPVEEVETEGSAPKQSQPAVSWHNLFGPAHPEEPEASRPTTPIVEDNLPNDDLIFLDEDALQEPPVEALPEASLQEISAMDTSKPSSPTSTGTSKRSPPASIDDISKDTSYTAGTSKRSPPASIDDISKDTTYTAGTSKRSPPASIDDISKDTSYTIDTLKPSPPASTDTSKISPPASVDVSKDKTALQDEDAQLEPPTGTLDEDAQLEPPTGKSTVLGIEGPSGFLARLSPMVRSPQRSPQRVPGASKMSSAATSRDASRQSTSSSVASGTSRKRLLERDEDDEPPTGYRAIDESDETVEYETRRTLATVLSELDDASRQSATAQDASRQSSLSAASMKMSGEESLTRTEARQIVAVISQVEEPSLETVTSMDISKPSSMSSMDDVSKGTTSTFEEEIYLQPDTFALAEEDARPRKSAKDGGKKAPTLYETLLENEAKAGIRPRVSPAVQPSQPSLRTAPDEPSRHSSSSSATSRQGSRSPEAMEVDEAAQPGAPEALVDEEAQPGAPEVLADVPQPVPAAVPVDSPQPGPSGLQAGSPRPGPSRMHVDSPQPGPSRLSAQKKSVFESSEESSLSNESSSDSTRDPFRRKTLKIFGTRLYMSSLPHEEVKEVNTLMALASATLEALNNGNAPFRFFVDLLGAILSNQYVMFELVKASKNERPNLHSELEYQCKMNYITMVKIERLIKSYTEDEGINQYLRGALKYIQATVHEIDMFNHAVYRRRGLTSLNNRVMAERIWKHVVKLQEKNISDRIRKKKNVRSMRSKYFNDLENSRLQTGFYQNFYDTYKPLRGFMQYLRMRYMPEGVVFSMDDLPGLRHKQDHFTMELTVVLPVDMLMCFCMQDMSNDRVVMDRSVMIEYVRLYVSRQFQTEDNFNKLFRELVNRIPRRQEDEEDSEDSTEVKALKEILFRDYKEFVDQLKKIGPFNFLIENMLDVLAKSLDLLLCLNKFTEKLTAVKQNLRQMVRGGPEEMEHKRRFDEYAAEIKNVVAGLQQYVYQKIVITQVKLGKVKNDLYGRAYNSFVDLLRLKIHELDRINTDRSIYESPEYISCTEKTSDDLWPVKVNEVYRSLESRFRYCGQTPLEKIPDAERKFIQKQPKLFSDNTYRAAVSLLLTLCTAVGNLEVSFRVKIEAIMSYTSVNVDDDAGLAADAAVDEAAAVAVDMADAAVDMAAVVIDGEPVDMADAAVDEAAAVAVDVAAVAINVADSATAAVDLIDAAAAVVDVADAIAVVDAVADVADVPAPAVGKVDDAVDIAASSEADEAEDL